MAVEWVEAFPGGLINKDRAVGLPDGVGATVSPGWSLNGGRIWTWWTSLGTTGSERTKEEAQARAIVSLANQARAILAALGEGPEENPPQSA